MNSVADEEMLENDVNYGIADCRKRLRSQRSSLRAHNPPQDGSSGEVHSAPGRVGSYAEVLANSSGYDDDLVSLCNAVRSVRDVARTAAQLGLQFEARGEGRALKQTPAAGSEVNTGQTIYVDFGRSQ